MATPQLTAETADGSVGLVLTPTRSRNYSYPWLLRRLLLGLLTVIAVSVVVFAATQLLPSDPARAILGRSATPEAVAALQHRFGLDKPALAQYFGWLGAILHGDFGISFANQQPVGALIANRIVNSLTLLILGAIIVVPLSFLLGTLSAARRGRLDRGLWTIFVVFAALPDFVVAITLVIVFAVTVFQFLPAVSLVPPGASPFDYPAELVLPVATLVLTNMPYIYRLVRASMIDVLNSEYVAMARLKGMPPHIVVVRHALRNAMLPAVQGSGLVLGWLFGSVVVVESVFQYPGLGSALTSAVANRDLPVIQAIVLIFTTGIVLFNITADAVTVYLTPRLRTGA